MSIRRMVFLQVCVSLSIILALVSSTGIAVANSRPAHHQGFESNPQPDHPQVFTHAGMPAYDSGWESLGVRPDPVIVPFTHNLGGDPDTYQVYLECRDNTSLDTYDCSNDNFYTQAHWFGLTDSTVNVLVGNGSQPDDIRVRIYTPTPAYDSGWESIGVRPDPIWVEFTHNLGGEADTYQVDLVCQDDSTLGTYDCLNDSFNSQSIWYSISNTVVSVYVIGGSRPDGVRIRIYTDSPAYDSGWESINVRPDPIIVPFTHNLGGDPDTYQVSLECRDNTATGTFDCTNGSNNTHSHWYGLTGTTIDVFVSGGSNPDAVRARIWLTSIIYLPIVIRPLE